LRRAVSHRRVPEGDALQRNEGNHGKIFRCSAGGGTPARRISTITTVRPHDDRYHAHGRVPGRRLTVIGRLALPAGSGRRADALADLGYAALAFDLHGGCYLGRADAGPVHAGRRHDLRLHALAAQYSPTANAAASGTNTMTASLRAAIYTVTSSVSPDTTTRRSKSSPRSSTRSASPITDSSTSSPRPTSTGAEGFGETSAAGLTP
jgi:hypothetical protein